MLRGLPASIILHGAVVFGGAVAWPYIAPERETEVLVPVTLDVQLDIETNFAPVVRREIVPDVPDPEPEEDAVEEDVEDDENTEEIEFGEDELETTDVRELEQEQAAEEEGLEVSEDAEDEPEDEPEEKEDDDSKARKQEPDSFESFLAENDKLFSEVKQTEKKNPPKKPKKTDIPLTDVEDPRKGVGDKSKETARIEALIYSQMIECWDGVLDQPNYERLQVTVRFKLTKDGALDGDVSLESPARVPVGDRPMRVAVERALRAARKCAPYRIPKDAQVSHDEWKDVVLDIGH